MEKCNIGTFQVERVLELAKPFVPMRDFFPDLTKEMLDEARGEISPGHVTDDDLLFMSFHSFVVKTGRHNILVDTCCGNDKQRPSRPEFSNMNNDFLGALSRAGITADQIDYVMCTHLHWDHVGWNTRLIDGRWVPTFPNAKYIMARREYDYWDQVYQSGVESRHRNGFEDSVMPLMRAEQAILVDDDFELEKGIWLEPCHGHSPGNVVINLKSGSDRGILSGDVIHHQIQLRYPHLSPTPADTDSGLSRKTRMAFIEAHAGTGHLLFPGHFPPPTIGRIEPRRGGDGFRYVA
ncbi:MAG TPA: MBL fold metallo-hydrolase [Hyphomicrobiaceae bacterium]|nr:MBL fold metallo-hydrolase [Hyphomicrobiaceae bacterium]